MEAPEITNTYGVVLETHRKVGYTIFVSYYARSHAGPDTEPLYSCWVERRGERRGSGELNDNEYVHPLIQNDVWNKINDFVNSEPALL